MAASDVRSDVVIVLLLFHCLLLFLIYVRVFSLDFVIQFSVSYPVLQSYRIERESWKL